MAWVFEDGRRWCELGGCGLSFFSCRGMEYCHTIKRHWDCTHTTGYMNLETKFHFEFVAMHLVSA
jgi:hypothetical protein